MNTLKTMLTQKSTWAGLAAVVVGVGMLATGEDKGIAIQTILVGIATICLRQAIAKV